MFCHDDMVYRDGTGILPIGSSRAVIAVKGSLANLCSVTLSSTARLLSGPREPGRPSDSERIPSLEQRQILPSGPTPSYVIRGDTRHRPGGFGLLLLGLRLHLIPRTAAAEREPRVGNPSSIAGQSLALFSPLSTSDLAAPHEAHPDRKSHAGSLSPMSGQPVAGSITPEG